MGRETNVKRRDAIDMILVLICSNLHLFSQARDESSEALDFMAVPHVQLLMASEISQTLNIYHWNMHRFIETSFNICKIGSRYHMLSPSASSFDARP